MSELDPGKMLAAIAKKRAQGNAQNSAVSDEFVLPANNTASGADTAAKRKGRRRGKRSDPNYKQTGVYLPAELTKRVKKRLCDRDIDFSDLIADLLAEWEAQESAKDN